MSGNGRTRLCGLADLTDGAARRFDVDGRRLAVVRVGDAVYVIGDRCSHAEASLSEGEVDCDTLHVECWRHGSSFSLLTGAPDVPPATRAVPVYETTVEGDEVFVALAVEAKESTNG